MQYTTEAVLLSARSWGDADKMVTLLTKDKGKITAIAYGCRRPRSRLSGGMQLFNHLELTVMSGSRVDTIKDCQVITPFKTLREDLERMAYASFVAELVTEFCPEYEAEPQIYALTLAALNALDRHNPRVAALIAASKLLTCAGFQPAYDTCVICGQTRHQDGFFSLLHSGWCCQSCHAPEDLPLDSAMLAFIHKMHHFDLDRPQPFKVSGAVLLKTERLLLAYLQSILEKPLKSLDFIMQLAQMNKIAAKR